MVQIAFFALGIVALTILAHGPEHVDTWVIGFSILSGAAMICSAMKEVKGAS